MVEPARGTLFLVVGPSGAGKDSLLDAARQTLEPGGLYRFPIREITRPASAGGEVHREVSLEAFAARRAAGGYALSWEAHGLCYGIDAGINADLAAGRHVVCNVSREVVDEARAMFQPLRVILVTASLPTLARRIALRGRESAEEVEERLSRSVRAEPQGPDVTVIRNEGTLETATQAFLEALQEGVSPQPA